MTPLTLRFKNLNSLYGEWEIDFTVFARSGGIFSITGPTGSGKTTVLDAISLALFGKTPRLPAITKSTNEIMSKNTGECYAELTFQTSEGAYRALWKQERSRNGELKSCFRELIDLKTGTLTEYGTEKIIGMNAADFTRSVLLAQGNFTAFLYAKENEKAAILENLTDAEIYRRISAKVYERAKDAEGELRIIRENSNTLKNRLLTPAETDALEKALADGRIQEQELISRKNIIEEEVRKAKTAVAIKQEIELINKAEAECAAEEKNFKYNRMRLDKGEKAARLYGLWQNINFYKDKVKTDETERKSLIESLSKAEREAGKVETVLKSAEDNFSQAAEELAAAEPKIKKVEALDVRILQLDTELNRLAADISKDEQSLAKSVENRSSVTKKISETQLLYEKRLKENYDAIEKISAAFSEAGNTPLSELINRREKSLLKADLSAHRERLEEGEPCPLCGSETHPYQNAGGAFQRELDDLDRIIKEASRLEEDKTWLSEEGKALLYRRDLELAKLTEQEKALAGIIEKEKTALLLKKDESEKLFPSAGLLKKERFDLLGDKSPQTEENRLKKARNEKNQALKDARLFREKITVKLAEYRVRREVLSGRIAADAQELSSASAVFQENLAKHGFTGIDEFQTALLSETEIADLRKRAETLSDRKKEIAVRRNDADRRALEAGSALISRATPEELEKKAEGIQKELLAVSRSIGENSQKRDNNLSLVKDAETAAAKADVFEKDIKKWRILNDLIGSAKGDKFARIVQTLLFGDLIAKANNELAKISARYRLVRGEALEILIMDNFHNGLVRPVANISGGESFLVSLALALGLSNLSARKTCANALFLDEGFSTLDPDHAEAVLTALSAVKSRRKLIGLISHMDILKEKIAGRINIEPAGGGKSAISGVGVKKL